MTEVQNSTPLLDTYETAHYLGLKNPGTLCNWRTMKKGPPFVRIGSNIRYRQSDLEHWLSQRRVAFPSQFA